MHNPTCKTQLNNGCLHQSYVSANNPLNEWTRETCFVYNLKDFHQSCLKRNMAIHLLGNNLYVMKDEVLFGWFKLKELIYCDINLPIVMNKGVFLAQYPLSIQPFFRLHSKPNDI